MLKVPRRKFPYDDTPDVRIESLAAEDLDKVQALVKSGDRNKLNSFINSRVAPYELNPHIDAGLETRDYLAALTGEAAMRGDPELRRIAEDGDSATLGKTVRSKMFSKIEDALKAHNLSTDIQWGSDRVTPEGKMYLSGRGTPATNVESAIHENAHLLDFLAQKHSKDKYIQEKQGTPIPENRRSSIAEFLKSKPAAIPLFTENPDEDRKFNRITTNSELENRYRDKVSNNPIYNFADYSFPEGEFKSDVIRNPLEVQDEAGSVHHIDRNQTYENMIKTLEDDGRLDRVTKNDRFKKLRGLIA